MEIREISIRKITNGFVIKKIQDKEESEIYCKNIRHVNKLVQDAYSGKVLSIEIKSQSVNEEEETKMEKEVEV